MDTQKLLKANSERVRLQLPEAPLAWIPGWVHFLHIMPHSGLWVSATWDCASLQEETDVSWCVLLKKIKPSCTSQGNQQGEWNPGSGEKKDTFYGSMHRLVHVCVLSHAQVFATPWTAARQAPLSMGFSRQEYWSGLPFSPPWDLPNLGIEPASPLSPALAGRSLDLEPTTVLYLSYSLEIETPYHWKFVPI